MANPITPPRTFNLTGTPAFELPPELNLDGQNTDEITNMVAMGVLNRALVISIHPHLLAQEDGEPPEPVIVGHQPPQYMNPPVLFLDPSLNGAL